MTCDTQYVDVLYDGQDARSHHKCYTYLDPSGRLAPGDRVKVDAGGSHVGGLVVRAGTRQVPASVHIKSVLEASGRCDGLESLQWERLEREALLLERLAREARSRSYMQGGW